jgi:hypothetical protein
LVLVKVLIDLVTAITQHGLLRNEFLIITIGIGIVIALIAMTAGYIWRLKQVEAARTFDRIFGLQERVSTAYELHSGMLSSSIPLEIIQRQLQDTLDKAQRIDPRPRLPLSVERAQIIFSIFLVLAIVLIGLRGEQLFQAAQSRRAVQQAINQEIEQIEALRTKIESDPRLTPEQKQELLQPLEETQGGLQDAQTAEQAVSVLTAAQEKLSALNDTMEQAKGLDEVGHLLDQQEDSPLQEVGENLASSDYLAAAQELRDVDLSTLSQQEQQELAEQLQEAAQALDSTSPQLAEQMRQAAEAIQQGNTQSASQALQDAAQTLSETGQQTTQSEIASQAAEQTGQGKAQILQAGQNAVEQGTGSNSSQEQSQGSQSGRSRQRRREWYQSGSEAGSQPIDQEMDRVMVVSGHTSRLYPTRLGDQAGEQVGLPEREKQEIIIGIGDNLPENLV